MGRATRQTRVRIGGDVRADCRNLTKARAEAAEEQGAALDLELSLVVRVVGPAQINPPGGRG